MIENAKNDDPYPFAMVVCYESCKTNENAEYSNILKEMQECYGYEPPKEDEIKTLEFTFQ